MSCILTEDFPCPSHAAGGAKKHRTEASIIADAKDKASRDSDSSCEVPRVGGGWSV